MQLNDTTFPDQLSTFQHTATENKRNKYIPAIQTKFAYITQF
jgi:hypothetical protein